MSDAKSTGPPDDLGLEPTARFGPGEMHPSAPLDRGYPKRIAIAVALALALHEVVAGLWPAPSAEEYPQQRIAAELVTLTRRPPRPTPRPERTPPPTPAPHYTFAPRFAVRDPAAKAAAPEVRPGGAAAPHRQTPLSHRAAARTVPPPSLAAGSHLGQQNGGTGRGAGAGNGTGGQNGTGSGSGAAGAGSGADANTAPCGDVYLIPGEVDYRPDGTVVQAVYAKVILRDGAPALSKFPYPFVYATAKLNPFVHEDQLAPDHGIPVQTPPPATDPATLTDVIATILKYTNPATGYTLLPACGTPAPVASPASPAAAETGP